MARRSPENEKEVWDRKGKLDTPHRKRHLAYGMVGPLLISRAVVRLNRPDWVGRLRRRLTRAGEETPRYFVAACVFGPLTFYVHDLSTTVGGDSCLGTLLEISTVCFGLAAAISALGFASSTCVFIVSSVVYHPVEGSYRVSEILLTNSSRLIRSFLAHADASRTFARTLCRLGALEPSDLLKLVTIGVAGEIISAIIRYIIEFWKDGS